MRFRSDIHELLPYINWPYFYHAWQVHDSEGRQRIRTEAMQRLESIEGRYHAYALFELHEAVSDGDDIVLGGGQRLPMLRQQTGSPCLSLADFIRPKESGMTDHIGLFATSVDIGMETDFASDDYERLMMQLLADRLAEAMADYIHLKVRIEIWGYAPDENLAVADILTGRFQGIRPAVGYPSLPDMSFNFVLNDILHMDAIGIRLTESGAMKPHASVSGLMFSHPQARYFDLGSIGDDQIADYAHRRGVPEYLIRKFIM